MKISIIVPIYNVEEYILNCLSSIVNKKKIVHSVECILVDDHGQDNSMQLAKHFIEEYSGDVEFKIVVHERNRGLSVARNSGLSECMGDYILFLDSDDTLPEDSLYNLSKPLEFYHYDFVLGQINTMGLVSESPSLFLDEGEYMGNEVVRETYLNHKWYMMAWNKLCNTNFLRKAHLYFEEGLIHEDDLWSFMLSLRADNFYVVRKSTYNYIIRGNSITTAKKQIVHIDSYLTIANKIADYIQAYSLKSEYVLFCHQYILGTYVYLRRLGFIEGYKKYKEIIKNKLYVNYYKIILKQEVSPLVFKAKLAQYPPIVGYIGFRILFSITSIKRKFRLL